MPKLSVTADTGDCEGPTKDSAMMVLRPAVILNICTLAVFGGAALFSVAALHKL
jgi:hypothetical protein